MAACSEDGSSGGQEFDSNEIYKHLVSVNVSDAKMIYTKGSPISRANGNLSSFDGVWKIDKNGNESKLIVTGTDGNTNTINIFEIDKLSDKFLLMIPDVYDTQRIWQEWENAHNDDPANGGTSSDGEHGPATQYAMLLNKETEKLYRFPENASIPYGVGEVLTDNQGNIYYKDFSRDGEKILKLSPRTMTIENSFPDGQSFTSFDVTGDGFIVYWSDYGDNKNYKVKCPGGRIYPITDVPFMINEELYSYKDGKIIKWETVGDNELKETEVCELSNSDSGHEIEIQQVLINYTKNTAVLRDNLGNWYEFNGETCNTIEIPQDFYWHDCFNTNKAWYRQEYTRFSKLSMADYQVSEFQVLDYEIQSLFASPESSNITFSGIDIWMVRM